MKRYILALIGITEPDNNDELLSKEEEAENLRFMMLDACGFCENIEISVNVIESYVVENGDKNGFSKN